MFSVIIPTRNRPDFLREAVGSVLSQSYQNFEILVVNDGDETIQFDDPRIRILDNKMGGAVPARNRGIANSFGSSIAFLDDDDVWIDVDHLARAHATEASFYFADGYMKFANGEAKPFSETANAETLRRDNTILISAVCYQKKLHENLGLFDETLPYYWDWDWYLRVASSGVFLHHCKTPVVDIRVHAQNMSAVSNLAARQLNLEHLCTKHNLRGVTLKNHTDFV